MSKTPKLRFKEFSGDWEEKKLGDITTLMQSGLSRQLSDKDIGVPVIRSNNLVDGKVDINDIKYWYRVDNQGAKLENYFLKKNDLMVNFINSLAQIGKCSVYKDELQRETIFTTNIMRLNFKDYINTNYIFNYFQLQKYNNYIQSITKPAVNQASFTTVDFKRFNISIPSLEEQEKIASFLALIDDKISLQNEKVEALKDYKNGMMQKIFTRELRFKDDEGRDYPEWEENKLGDIAEIIMGQSPSSTSYNEEYIGLPLIQGNADVQNRKTLPRVYTSEITKTCDIGDIIMSVRAPVGAISKSLHNACIGRGVCSIKPKYSTEYIYQFLLKYESKWSQISQGSTFESVNSNDIKSLKVPFPNLDEQDKIGKFLSEIDNKIEKEKEKLNSLKQYKKGLLQQMFV